MKRTLATVGLMLAVACGHPNPTCLPTQTACDGGCFDLTSTRSNCGACGVACGTDQICTQGACTYTSCSAPDVYATCWNGGGFTGLCSASGEGTSVATIAAPSPDGGGPIVGQLQSAVFASASTVWLLDVENAQIDVIDISQGLPSNVRTIAAGTVSYDPVQLIACGSQMLLLRSSPALLEIFDAASGAVVNEVSLELDGGYPFPNAVACAGGTAYVADPSDNVVFVIDLASHAITGTLPLPAAAQVPPPAADGGTFYPSLAVVAVATVGQAPVVYSALQNYAIFPQSDGGLGWVLPVADSSVLVSSGTTVLSTVDLGPCYDAFALATAPDQSKVYASCAGKFHIAGTPNASGQLGVLSTATNTAGTPIALPLSNPGAMAFLKNGVLAIADTGQARIAFYNPADGGVTSAPVGCALLPDGGANPLQFVSAVVATP